MTARLAASSHGESRLRLLHVVRSGDRHDPRDLTCAVRFEGDFTAAFVEGRTQGVVPGETLKGLVRQAIRAHGSDEIERMALDLSARVLDAHRQISRVRVEVVERAWARVEVAGKSHEQAFVVGGPEERTAVVTSNGERSSVVSGIAHLPLMRTAGFLDARSGVRAEDGSEDGVSGLLVGVLSARWSYRSADVTFGPTRHGVREALLDTFARHAARSVEFTLYAMAEVVLAMFEDVSDVTLRLDERPNAPADPFAVPEGADDLFIPADEPVRRVEMSLERGEPRSTS